MESVRQSVDAIMMDTDESDYLEELSDLSECESDMVSVSRTRPLAALLCCSRMILLATHAIFGQC